MPVVARSDTLANLLSVPSVARGAAVGHARSASRRAPGRKAARRREPAHRPRARRLFSVAVADRHARQRIDGVARPVQRPRAVLVDRRRPGPAADRAEGHRSQRRRADGTARGARRQLPADGADRRSRIRTMRWPPTRRPAMRWPRRPSARRICSRRTISPTCGTRRAILRTSRCSTRSASCCRRRRCRSWPRAMSVSRWSILPRRSAAAGIT